MPSAKESDCQYAKSASNMTHAIIKTKAGSVSLCGAPIVVTTVTNDKPPTLCFRCQQRMKRN